MANNNNIYSGGWNNYQQYAFVNGIEGAKAHIMPYNSSMLLMDADHPICYRKESDNQGRCSLRYFQLTEIDEATARSIMQPQPQNEQNGYASKDDINNINKRLDDLFKMLNSKSNNRKEVKDNNA